MFREHVNSAGAQVSTVPPLSINVAPSEGHNCATPVNNPIMGKGAGRQ